VEVRPTPVLSNQSRMAVKRRYDMRHQCQEILPGLLLGPFQVSKNLTSLKELGISHMYASCPSETFAHLLSFVPFGYPATPESAFAMSRKRSQFAPVFPDPLSISFSMCKIPRSKT
jgi:hypothetical protein